MAKDIIRRTVMTGMIVGVFTLGYFCGSVSQHGADAQNLGGILEQAGKAGGPLGAVSQHVSGLQKNIDALKKVQSALTGK